MKQLALVAAVAVHAVLIQPNVVAAQVIGLTFVSVTEMPVTVTLPELVTV